MDPFSIPSTRLSAKDAVICHDVGPITHPELFDPNTRPIYDHIYKQVAEIGPHVIFVSQATQKAFAACYPNAKLASERVIYPAIRQDVSGGDAEPVDGVKGPFLLTVGALGTRKNQIRSMKAFTQSGLAKRGVTYVLCGSKEPGFEAVQKAALETEGVVMLKYVSDAQLAWLYQNASGFVLPSLLEGFGMPVAEAIRYGLVPLVTKDSVLEEVAGDGALGVDALNEAEIAAAMVTLIDMPETERAERRAKMTAAMSRFVPAAIAQQWREALVDMVR
nr:glycosyltransferase family 1 protein [Asticcacaulis machinosus]